MILIGSTFCVDTYQKLAKALFDGGVDGFLLESLNCWDEVYYALEGVKRMTEVLNSISIVTEIRTKKFYIWL